MTHRPPYPGMPRWAKAFSVVGIVLVLLIVALAIAGGNHGPGRHIRSNAAVDAASSKGPEGVAPAPRDHEAPEGAH